MKMKKLFAGLVATSMIAAMGTSAFAAVNEYALTPTVDETGVVAISDADVAKLALYGDTQMTVLIIPEAAYNKMTDDDDTTNITDGDIYYIDQEVATKGGLFQAMGLKCGADLIPEGATSATYYVRVGGAYDINDGIYEGSFTVTTTPAGVEITRLYGDVTGDDFVDVEDALQILYYDAFMDSVFDDGAEWREIAGDVTGDDFVDVEDALQILYYDAFMDSVFDTMDEDSFTYVEE